MAIRRAGDLGESGGGHLPCLISLDVPYAFMSGSFPILVCLIAMICWSATIRVASIKTLLTEFADTVAAQKLTGTRERSYELVIETFVRSWKRSDHGEIATFIPDSDWRTLAMKRLDRSLERCGFTRDKLPSIDDRRDLWARNTPVVKTYFRIPAMQGERQAKLRTRWEEIDSMWKLTEIGLRKTKRE